jgi:hypothetical protein
LAAMKRGWPSATRLRTTNGALGAGGGGLGRNPCAGCVFRATLEEWTCCGGPNEVEAEGGDNGGCASGPTDFFPSMRSSGEAEEPGGGPRSVDFCAMGARGGGNSSSDADAEAGTDADADDEGEDEYEGRAPSSPVCARGCQCVDFLAEGSIARAFDGPVLLDVGRGVPVCAATARAARSGSLWSAAPTERGSGKGRRAVGIGPSRITSVGTWRWAPAMAIGAGPWRVGEFWAPSYLSGAASTAVQRRR